jgi:anti-sigma regulatory factor (Ser/Thr protein kinase)
MADELALEIKNTFESVHSTNETVSRWLAERKAPAEIQYFANLAIEEFVTNSIKYGYEDANEHVIEVSLSLSNGELAMTLTDDGRAFNPLQAPPPDLHLAVEERPVGGLGIYLVRKMSDRMEYAREGTRNRLTFHKLFPKPKGA